MMKYTPLLITTSLSLLMTASSFLTNMNGPLDVFVDVPKPSTSNYRFSRHRLLSSKNPGEIDGSVPDDCSNSTKSSAIGNQTKTKGYQRIEEWHEESRDPKEVIRNLKQEKARWKKTFDEFGK